MSVRMLVLADASDQSAPALLKALEEDGAEIELRTLRSASLARFPQCALHLATYRPDLIVAQDFGPRTLQAAVYRSLARRSRLLLSLTEPLNSLGPIERFVLSKASGVLVEGHAVAFAVEQLGVPASRIVPIPPGQIIEPYAACPQARPDPAARRLACVGELSPQSGVADLLIGLAAWGEQHPDRPVEIWWIGEGDLAGVLEAQPLPDNVSQRFLGALSPVNIAAAFAQCGLLAVPSLGDDRDTLIPEALASGLLVLGSRRSRRARQFVREGVTGWLFDPLRTEDIVRALDRALGNSVEQLDMMREVARAVVRQHATQDVTERLRRKLLPLILGPGFASGVALEAS